MTLEETTFTHRDWLDTWKLLHASTWAKFASPSNEALLLKQAETYRPCATAFDRSFHQLRDKFTRVDGKTELDDERETAERIAIENAELEKNAVVTVDAYNYALTLGPHELVEAYKDPTFARVYRRLQREFGFKAVPVFAAAPKRVRR